MSVLDDCRIALFTRANSVVGIPSRVFENIRFDPAVLNEYVRVSFVPASSRPTTIGVNPKQRHDGLLSMLVCVPAGEGTGDSQTYADLIMSAFSPSTDLTYGSTVVSVDYCETFVGYFDEPFYCVPVTVGWHTYS